MRSRFILQKVIVLQRFVTNLNRIIRYCRAYRVRNYGTFDKWYVTRGIVRWISVARYQFGIDYDYYYYYYSSDRLKNHLSIRKTIQVTP